MYHFILFALFVCPLVYITLRSFAPHRNATKRTLQDSSAQTEETRQEPHDSALSIPVGDEVDNGDSREAPVQNIQTQSVKTSLQQVFACAYSQFLSSPEVPEPMDEQPLYKALWRELDLATDCIMGTVYGLDIAAVSTGCIDILTHHLRDMKEARRELFFRSWENEVAFLRVCSEALVQNFLPESTWKPDLYNCVLKEIVAFKVLLLLVTLLSDPDTLNQLVVRSLGVASPCSSTVELREPVDERAATEQPEDDGGTTDSQGATDNIDIKTNRKGKTIKASLGKIFKRSFRKIFRKTKKNKVKNKESETGPSFRALELENLSDEEDDDSLSSSTSEDSPHLTPDQEIMMHDLLNELWRGGRWMVTVPQVEEHNKELVFTIYLEEQNSPEDLHWDVRMSEKQLQVLKSHLQDSTVLSLPDVSESTDRILDDKSKEEARVKLEHFLQKLISQSEVSHSQEVFHLLFDPFCSSLCELLDRLPFFFSSTLDDEKSVTHMKTDQGELNPQAPELQTICGNRRQPGGSPNPPTKSMETCGDEEVQKVYECAKKTPNMDPSISRSDTSSFQFRHGSVGSASNLDQLAKWSTSEPTGSGKDQPPDRPANQGTDQPLDLPANRGMDQPTDQPAKWGTDQPTDQPAKWDQPAKRGTDQPTNQSAKGGMDQPTNQPVNQGTDQPTTRPANQHTDQPIDQLANQGKGQIGNNGTDQFSYQGRDQPANQGIHLTIDQFAQCGTNQPINQPADGGSDQRTEQPAIVPMPLLCCLSQDEGSKTNQKSNPPANTSVGIHGKEAKNQGPEQEEKAASQRKGVDQLMKALMDLLKEIFSNSWFIVTLKTFSTMFRPLVLKELISILNNLKLTDSQIASHLDSLREALWPKGMPAVRGPPLTSEEKIKMKEKACNLLIARFPWILRSNVKSAFEVLQDAQENKKLVYKLLSFLLRQLFPGDREFHSKAAHLLKSPPQVEELPKSGQHKL